jgi:rhomboid protease GluP
MLYELALISVLVAGGYWGLYFARLDSVRTYGLMLIGAAALCGAALLGRHYEVDALGLAGAIGVGTGTCLLVVGPVVRVLARRAAASERFALAQRLLDIADVLAPGSGVADEKQLLGAMRELRDGNIEKTVDALRAAKDRAPAEARHAIDERIAMLYLAAYRWDDAIAHAEAHLFDTLTDGAGPAPGSLRRALGIAPPVYVELLGAYGYKGDLDRAAAMLARLEVVCAGREDAAIWLHRGRTIFLALAGRVDAVQTLVAPRRSRHMSRAARTYWIAVAHERRGEAEQAEAAYARARSKSRGRPRMLIDQALQRVQAAKPVELGPAATEVVARVEAEPPPAVTQLARPRGPVATRLLLAGVLGVAAAIAIALGDSGDVGVLVRAGAMVRSLVDAGEWWRAVSCIFVHVGGVHLLVNAIGLWFLGKLAEELFGPWRTAAVFAIAGLAGAIASFLASPAGVSAGASGAIFGLLGAIFVELTWQRRRHRAAWSRGVWGSVVVVVVAQLGIDFIEPMTDQWAHVGGLATGALLGFVLSPNARWHKPLLHVARVLAVGFAALAAVAAVQVVRTPITSSLARDWQLSGIVDVRLLRGDLDQIVDEMRPGFDQLAPAPTSIIPLPAGWHGQELLGSATDPLDNLQKNRIVLAVRPDGIVVKLEVPETLARSAPAFFAQLVARQ